MVLAIGARPRPALRAGILTEQQRADALTRVGQARGGSVFCPRSDMASYGGPGSIKEPAVATRGPRLSHGLVSVPSVVRIGRIEPGGADVTELAGSGGLGGDPPVARMATASRRTLPLM